MECNQSRPGFSWPYRSFHVYLDVFDKHDDYFLPKISFWLQSPEYFRQFKPFLNIDSNVMIFCGMFYWLGLVYFFNGPSSAYGLFNVEFMSPTWFIFYLLIYNIFLLQCSSPSSSLVDSMSLWLCLHGSFMSYCHFFSLADSCSSLRGVGRTDTLFYLYVLLQFFATISLKPNISNQSVIEIRLFSLSIPLWLKKMINL